MPSEGERRRALAFLTAPPALAAPLFAAARQREPSADWTVYYRLPDRYELGSALEAATAVSDKPMGSKLAFLRGIRRQRADLAVVLWTGDHRYDRMKVVALVSGARRILVCDECGDAFFLTGRTALRCLRHATWRPSWGSSELPFVVGLAAFAYRWTIGFGAGAAWLMGRLAWRRWDRARRIESA
jgi:hypothetical protein